MSVVLGQAVQTASIYKGDCLTLIPEKIPDDTIDLIITSPPYADQRKDNYRGGVCK